MDAVCLAFPDASMDATICVQNGICAFGVEPAVLLREALRVTRPRGLVLLSSYAETFWPHRLAWFQEQAAQGLVGEIDYDRCGNGVIACRDGFRAATMRPSDFERLCDCLAVRSRLTEVDTSSLFCEIGPWSPA